MNANVQTLDTMPWYKYKAPWLLMSVPALTVVAGIATLVIALATSDGMVEEDYYKRGLAVNQDITRDRKAEDLGLSAELMVGMKEVRVFLDSKTGMQLPDSLVVHFKHATRGGMDQAIALKHEGGFYVGNLEELAPGKWRLALEDTDGVWRLMNNNFFPTQHESASLLPLPVLAASRPPAD